MCRLNYLVKAIVSKAPFREVLGMLFVQLAAPHYSDRGPLLPVLRRASFLQCDAIRSEQFENGHFS